MTLKVQIQNDITKYMKEKNTFARDTLRLVLGEIQSAEKSGKTPKDFSDLETEAFLAKQVKTRRESARIYAEAGEVNRAQKETAEANLIATYLPKQLDEVVVQAIVNAAFAKFESPTLKQMGQIMALVNAEVKGRFDGKTISQMVRSKLA
jgi:uncharacterized protein YqeY